MDIVATLPTNIEAPNILVGLPDVGLVGTIAVSYVIEKLKMSELGYIDSPRFPPMVIIRESAVKNPIRIYGKDDIIAIISDLPLYQSLINPFFEDLVEWIKKLRPRTIIGITGLPTQDRMQVNKPEVVGISTTPATRELLDNAGVKLLSDGVFFGTYAALVRECSAQRVPCITLLALSHLNFPDPAASLEALSIVNKILNIEIDLKQLEQEAERIKISTRELMLLTERALKEVQRLREGRPQAIYR